MDRWITSARQRGLAPLVRFTVSLLDDLDAVHAAVALPYNSGVAEGRITDLKMISVRWQVGPASSSYANASSSSPTHAAPCTRPPRTTLGRSPATNLV